MEKNPFYLEPRFLKSIAVVILIAFSFFACAPIAAKPETYAKTMQIIDDNKLQAVTITTVVTGASVAISALGDDMGSSIAQELSDLTTPLFLIVCVLFCEKFLLTTLGALSWGALLPAAGGFYIASLWKRKYRKRYRIYAQKFVLIALLCALIIPLSAGLTYMIEKTLGYEAKQALAEIQRLGDIFSPAEDTENMNAFSAFFANLASGVTQVGKLAKDLLSLAIDAIAVLIVTSCLVPLLTVVFLVWSVRSILRNRLEDIHVAFGIVHKEMLQVKESLNKLHKKDDDIDDDDQDIEVA